MFGSTGAESEGVGPCMSYCTVSDSCQDAIPRCNDDHVVFHSCLWYRKYA
jgi:hypothetical protein